MKNLTCILCPNGCTLSADCAEGVWTVNGNKCQKGIAFAIAESTNPTRSISSTVKTIYKEMPRLPVRTDGEIPLADIFPSMQEINNVVVDRVFHTGETVIENLMGTGINVIATSDMGIFMGEE